jgi:hypothetical protein
MALTDNEIKKIAEYMWLINVIMNVSASFITILMIWRLWKKKVLRMNLYIKCVLIMTIFQLILDGSIGLEFYCAETTTYHTCTSIFVGGFGTGGIGASIWSFLIVSAALFTVEFSRNPTHREQAITFIISMSIILAYAIVFSHGGYIAHDDLPYFDILLSWYNLGRFTLIGLTLMAIGRLYYLLLQTTIPGHRKTSPLYYLLRKLVYYPIVQILCRLACAPYNYIYKNTIGSYPSGGNGGIIQQIFLFIFVIGTPTAGLGGLFVFFTMQSGAKSELIEIITFNFYTRNDKNGTICRMTAELIAEKAAAVIINQNRNKNHEENTNANTVIEKNSLSSIELSITLSPTSPTANNNDNDNDNDSNFSSMDESDLVKIFLKDENRRTSLRRNSSMASVTMNMSIGRSNTNTNSSVYDLDSDDDGGDHTRDMSTGMDAIPGAVFRPPLMNPVHEDRIYYSNSQYSISDSQYRGSDTSQVSEP